MKIVLCFLLLAVAAALENDEIECDPRTQVPCDRSGCIDRQLWCDSIPDCDDASDEIYCISNSTCLLHHFKCNDGSCIPITARCDSFENCKDGSDEICDSTTVLRDSPSSFQLKTISVDSAVMRAAEWILDQRQNDYSWGAMTSRAAVALSFADGVVNLSKEEKSTIIKGLNILLSLDLMRDNGKLSLSQLSLYINALYATCEDPTNFKGVDLVSSLRHEVDMAVSKGNFSLPVAMLSLCIAGKSTRNDLELLMDIYKGQETKTGRIDTKAIALMGMCCISNLPRFHHYRSLLKQTFADFREMFGMVAKNSDFDVYTKALYLQATIAMGYPVDGISLLHHQQPDGSFGDLLATYYVIPVLMNSSLISLSKKCQRNEVEGTYYGVSPLETSQDVAKMTYSIWIGSGIDKNTHSVEISFSNKTLLDLMRIAEGRDKMYRFSCDDTPDGKKLYSLAGVPDDAEIGKFWSLYFGKGDDTSTRQLRRENRGLDRIYPKDGNHFIFWFDSK